MRLGIPGGRRALLAPFGIGLVFALVFVLVMTTATTSLRPHDLPVGLVAPAPLADRVASSLNVRAAGTFDVQRYGSAAAARQAVVDGDEQGALVVGANGARLVLASANGSASTSVIRTAFTAVARAAHLPLVVQDVRPMPGSDPSGPLAAVLLIPLILASIIAAVLGFLLAPWAAAAVRLGLLGAYALAVGLGVALIAYLVGGGLSGDFVAAWGAMALFVAAMAGAVTCLQRLAGVAGTGVAVLVLLVLGLPSAGVFAPYEFLPDLYRALSQNLPPGAAVTLMRDVLYLGGDGAGRPIAVLALWAGVAAAATLVADAVLPRASSRSAVPRRPSADAVLAAMIYLAIRRRDPAAPVPETVRAQLTSLLEAPPPRRSP